MTVSGALAQAISVLKYTSDTPALDAEILLAHVLKLSRSYFYAWPEKEIAADDFKKFSDDVAKRKTGEPIAYLTGHQEFWSLDFLVTQDVLIPRPETEILIENVLQNFSGKENITLADLGTGSGAIAIALANEKPNWHIHATDQSSSALAIAKKNAKRLSGTNINFHQGDWCAALPEIFFDVIVSNPPYVASHEFSSALQFEPRDALVSEQAGLQDIQIIIAQAKSKLKPKGILFLEHGFQQGDAVRKLFEKNGYSSVVTKKDLAGLERVSYGVFSV